jgi:hypothetical protein
MESDAGGVADEKRLGETEDGEKKPVAAAVAARIAMVAVPSSLALLPGSPLSARRSRRRRRSSEVD